MTITPVRSSINRVTTSAQRSAQRAQQRIGFAAPPVDWILVLATAAILVVGTLLVWSST